MVFRKGKQTTDVVRKVIAVGEKAINYCWKYHRLCVLITIGIRNAFNTASWKRILDGLEEMKLDKGLLKIISSYLSNRRISQQKTLRVNR